MLASHMQMPLSSIKDFGSDTFPPCLTLCDIFFDLFATLPFPPCLKLSNNIYFFFLLSRFRVMLQVYCVFFFFFFVEKKVYTLQLPQRVTNV